MANIASELNKIHRAQYGRDNRMPIHDALKKINDELEELKEGGDDIGEHHAGIVHNS